jgi:hypothetical protein
LLIVTGYHRHHQTCAAEYKLPKDKSAAGSSFGALPHAVALGGMTEDADWGKMMPTWGNDDQMKEVDQPLRHDEGFAPRTTFRPSR